MLVSSQLVTFGSKLADKGKHSNYAGLKLRGKWPVCAGGPSSTVLLIQNQAQLVLREFVTEPERPRVQSLCTWL